MNTWFSRTSLSLAFILAMAACGSEGPADDADEAQAVDVQPDAASASCLAGMSVCGTSTRQSFWGTTAYSNGTYNGQGTSCVHTPTYLSYQCHDLVLRHFANMGIHPKGRFWTTLTMCDSTSGYAGVPGVDVTKNANSDLLPGDVISWKTHTAIVTAVTPSTISIIQQNVACIDKTRLDVRDTLSWNGHTIPPNKYDGAAFHCRIRAINACPTVGAVQGCVTGDPGCPCSPCGHRSRSCQSNHTWGAWSSCQNGC